MAKTIKERFAQFDDDFLKFERVETKRANCADLHAFLLLDELFPSKKKLDMVSAASHDQIWLRIDEKQIEKLTNAQIQELVRCGLFYDDKVDSLSSFV